MTLFSLPPDEEPLYEGDLPPDPVSESQARASRDGKEFDLEAFELLASLGATVVEQYPKACGFQFDALVEGANGKRFLVAAHGTPDKTDLSNGGLRRQDTILKAGFRALRLHAHKPDVPLLWVTSHMPRPGSSSAFILQETADALWDAVAIGDVAGFQRLRSYFTETPAPEHPLPAQWREVVTQPALFATDPLDADD